jgi:hypothetical protein
MPPDTTGKGDAYLARMKRPKDEESESDDEEEEVRLDA